MSANFIDSFWIAVGVAVTLGLAGLIVIWVAREEQARTPDDPPPAPPNQRLNR